MPIRAGIRKPGVLTVFFDVGKYQNFRMLGMVELIDHVGLGAADLPSEFEKLLRLQPLSAQHQHLSAIERLLDFGEQRPVDQL